MIAFSLSYILAQELNVYTVASKTYLEWRNLAYEFYI